MELKQFIKTCLVDILEAIDEAQQELGPSTQAVRRGAINPIWNDFTQLRKHTQEVSFDIAVTVGAEESASGKAGVRVLEIGAGAELARSSSASQISRISFKVPILPKVWLITDVQDDQG